MSPPFQTSSPTPQPVDQTGHPRNTSSSVRRSEQRKKTEDGQRTRVFHYNARRLVEATRGVMSTRERDRLEAFPASSTFTSREFSRLERYGERSTSSLVRPVSVEINVWILASHLNIPLTTPESARRYCLSVRIQSWRVGLLQVWTSHNTASLALQGFNATHNFQVMASLAALWNSLMHALRGNGVILDCCAHRVPFGEIAEDDSDVEEAVVLQYGLFRVVDEFVYPMVVANLGDRLVTWDSHAGGQSIDIMDYRECPPLELLMRRRVVEFVSFEVKEWTSFALRIFWLVFPLLVLKDFWCVAFYGCCEPYWLLGVLLFGVCVGWLHAHASRINKEMHMLNGNIFSLRAKRSKQVKGQEPEESVPVPVKRQEIAPGEGGFPSEVLDIKRNASALWEDLHDKELLASQPSFSVEIDTKYLLNFHTQRVKGELVSLTRKERYSLYVTYSVASLTRIIETGKFVFPSYVHPGMAFHTGFFMRIKGPVEKILQNYENADVVEETQHRSEVVTSFDDTITKVLVHLSKNCGDRDPLYVHATSLVMWIVNLISSTNWMNRISSTILFLNGSAFGSSNIFQTLLELLTAERNKVILQSGDQGEEEEEPLWNRDFSKEIKRSELFSSFYEIFGSMSVAVLYMTFVPGASLDDYFKKRRKIEAYLNKDTTVETVGGRILRFLKVAVEGVTAAVTTGDFSELFKSHDVQVWMETARVLTELDSLRKSSTKTEMDASITKMIKNGQFPSWARLAIDEEELFRRIVLSIEDGERHLSRLVGKGPAGALMANRVKVQSDALQRLRLTMANRIHHKRSRVVPFTVLLEGAPGTGKTKLLPRLARLTGHGLGQELDGTNIYFYDAASNFDDAYDSTNHTIACMDDPDTNRGQAQQGQQTFVSKFINLVNSKPSDMEQARAEEKGKHAANFHTMLYCSNDPYEPVHRLDTMPSRFWRRFDWRVVPVPKPEWSINPEDKDHLRRIRRDLDKTIVDAHDFHIYRNKQIYESESLFKASDVWMEFMVLKTDVEFNAWFVSEFQKHYEKQLRMLDEDNYKVVHGECAVCGVIGEHDCVGVKCGCGKSLSQHWHSRKTFGLKCHQGKELCEHDEPGRCDCAGVELQSGTSSSWKLWVLLACIVVTFFVYRPGTLALVVVFFVSLAADVSEHYLEWVVWMRMRFARRAWIQRFTSVGWTLARFLHVEGWLAKRVMRDLIQQEKNESVVLALKFGAGIAGAFGVFGTLYLAYKMTSWLSPEVEEQSLDITHMGPRNLFKERHQPNRIYDSITSQVPNFTDVAKNVTLEGLAGHCEGRIWKIVAEVNGEVRNAVAFHLEGQIFWIPAHFLSVSEQDKRDTWKMKLTQELDYVISRHNGNQEYKGKLRYGFDVMRVGHTDCALIVVHGVAPVTSILKHMPTTAIAGVHAEVCDAGYVVVVRNDVPVCHKVLPIGQHVGMHHMYRYGDGTVLSRGDCGAPVLVRYGGQVYLAGLHLHKVANFNRGEEISVAQIRDALAAMEQQSLWISPEPAPVVEEIVKDIEVQHLAEKSHCYSLPSNVVLLGTMKKAWATKFKHSVTDTLMANTVRDICLEWSGEEVPFHAPSTRGFVDSNGEWKQAVDNAFAAQENADFDVRYMVKSVQDFVGSEAANFPGIETLRPLTKREAFFGTEDGFIGGENPKTSAGPPWNCQKHKLFGIGTNGKAWYAPEVDRMWDELTHYVEVEGRFPASLVRTALKDEPISTSKKENGSVRQFQVCNFVYNAFKRKHLGPLMRVMQQYRDYFECQVGANYYGKDLQLLCRRLETMCNGPTSVFGDGDFKFFDLKQNSRAMHYVAVCWLALGLLWYPEKEMALSAFLCALMDMSTYRVINGDVYYTCSGMPSGSLMTAHGNSIFVSLVMRYVWFMHNGLDAPRFRDWVLLLVLGDDNAYKSRDKTKFSFDIVMKYVGEMGLVYTPAEKDAVTGDKSSMLDIEFLKRKFRFDGDLQMWMAPLAKKSLCKMLTKKTRSELSDVDHAATILSNVAREIFLHGREEFLSVRERLLCEGERVRVVNGCEVKISESACFLVPKWDYDYLAVEYRAGVFVTMH